MGERFTVTLSLTSLSRKDCEDAVVKFGSKNLNQFADEALSIVAKFDKGFIELIRSYAEQLQTDVSTVIQNMMIDRFAKEEALAAVWGPEPRFLLEFQSTIHGMLYGKELFECRYSDYERTEVQKRYEAIKNDALSFGTPLSQDDLTFLKKYGLRNPVEEKEDRDWAETEGAKMLIDAVRDGIIDAETLKKINARSLGEVVISLIKNGVDVDQTKRKGLLEAMVSQFKK